MKNPLTELSKVRKRAVAGVQAHLAGPLDAGPRLAPQTDVQRKALTIAGNLPKNGQLNDKRRVVPHHLVASLARTDPICAGLISLTKSIVAATPWDIVPDIADQVSEMNRWEDQACDMVNEWGYKIPFASSVLPGPLVEEMTAEIAGITKKAVSKTDSAGDQRKRRSQIQSYFRLQRRAIEQTALVHCTAVRELYRRPNNHWEKSLRALHELVLGDLLTDDAGVIVKNYTVGGQFAEMYRIPGWQVTPISFPDYTVPQPPQAAYVWATGSKIMGWFTNDELVKIMANPQGDGNGLSPMDILLQLATATITGDKQMFLNLKEGMLPPGLLNLKDATTEQRDAIAAELYSQMAKSGGNRISVLNTIPSDDGEFQYQEFSKGHDFQKMQLMEFLQLSAGIKAFVFGFQMQDLGLVLDASQGAMDAAEVVKALHDRPGISGRLDLLESYHNGEIVREEWPFTDVKFAYDRQGGLLNDVLEQSQADSVDVAAGILSVNEIRKRRKMRPTPGGDIQTKATGNALLPLDVLQFAEGNDGWVIPGQMGQQGDGNGGAAGGDGDVKPAKRNNANNRQNMNGHEPRT